MLAAKSIQGLHRLETARPAADVMQRCVEAGYRAPTLDALVAAALFRSETPSTRGHKRAGSRLVINHTGKVPATGAPSKIACRWAGRFTRPSGLARRPGWYCDGPGLRFLTAPKAFEQGL